MPLLYILAEALGTILGSLAAAVALGTLCWWLAGRVHHRSWSWMLLLAMVVAVWLDVLGHGEFFKMIAMFGLLGTAGLYFAAKEVRGWSQPPASTDRHTTHGKIS